MPTSPKFSQELRERCRLSLLGLAEWLEADVARVVMADPQGACLLASSREEAEVRAPSDRLASLLRDGRPVPLNAGYAAQPLAGADGASMGILEVEGIAATLAPARCLALLAHAARGIEDQLALAACQAESERLKLELRVQRERMSLVTEISGIGVWDYNLDADSLICDETCMAMYGLPGAPERMKTIADFQALVHPEDVERVTNGRIAELEVSQQDRQIEFRMIRPSGEIRWITSAACMVPASETTPNRLVCAVIDVTEARIAAAKLQRSYDALRRAERLSKVGSWTLNLATGDFETSEMLYEMNGADPKGPALTVADLQRLLAPESFQEISEAVGRCARTGEAYGIDARHLRPDGSSFAVHIRGEALRGPDGAIEALTGTVQDISEREESRARLQALADNLPNGAIYRLELDQAGEYRLTYVSAGLERLIGVRPEQAMADRGAFLSAIHPDDVDHYLLEVEKSRQEGVVFDCEFRARRPDGSTLWMRCRSAPRAAGAGTAWDGIMLDVTREKDAAREIQLAKEAAEAGERAKSDFLATMSHEIRTPMNTVIGMARLVQQTDLSLKQRNYLEKIDVSAKALLGIINDVLDYSKIEAGMLAMDVSDFDLDEVLETVSATTSARAEEKGVEIAYAVAPDVPRRLRGDAFRLGQVLTNLVGNAVKFTRVGEIVVSVETQAGGMLAFAVRDTGIGLSQEQISHLFRPFSQADVQTSRNYGGTGLGLAICQRLVTLMGGRIGVESAPGQGSTFRFSLPISPAQERATAAAMLLEQSALVGARALIVDDNASAREILSEILREFGMRVDSAASGIEGLHAVRQSCRGTNPYEVVLMDWRMPGMDGLEVARRLREEERLAHMPAVLMVTAYGREEVLKRAEELKLQGMLIKPITASVMFNTLVQILRPLTPVRAPERPQTQQIAPGGVHELAGRRILVVDDNALNREVASDFLELAGVVVSTAKNGREALEALENGEFDAVLMDIHMPEMDGLEATRIIRQQPEWATLPIVALTAQARPEDRSIVADAGMNAHLAKPIDEAALYSVLAREIAEHQGTPAAAIPEPAPPPERFMAGPAPWVDMAAIEARFGISSPRTLRLLDGFLRDYADTPAECDRLAAGDDLQAVALLVHTLKGTVGYLGADRLGEDAARIEEAARHGDLAFVRQTLPAFARDLRLLLGEVRAARRRAVPEDDMKAPALAPIRSLIAELRPLILSGDYGAVAKLESLAGHLREPEQIALMARIREEVDDLQRDEALSSLRNLAATLSEAGLSDA